MKVTDCIDCPKCHKKFLRKVQNPEWGKEYFCHFCHVYFGVSELVNQWNYDAGDLFGYNLDGRKYVKSLTEKYYPPTVHYSKYDNGEPMWRHKTDRVSAYNVVDNMYAGIREMEAFELWKNKLDNDYADLIATKEGALDASIQ